MTMKTLKTVEEFKAHVAAVQARAWWRASLGYGVARVDYGAAGNTIRAAIPVVNWAGTNQGSLAVMLSVLEAHGVDMTAAGDELVVGITEPMLREMQALFAPYMDDLENHANVHVVHSLASALENGDFEEDGRARFKLVVLFNDAPCKSVESVYLKLLALSLGFAKPRTLNLTGIFGILPNLAWADGVPYELSWLRQNKIALQLAGHYPAIEYVDKIPRFLNHVIPADNTRLLDGGKVRLGAHVADGTTMMPGASYINFNAGTLGPAMIEGRVSSSVIVGAGTDIGGGASILGVLSGGNSIPVTIGANCLLGANCVCGISLGDGCIIDAGVTVLAGSKIAVDADSLAKIKAVNPKFEKTGTSFKGSDLSGLHGIHYRLDTATGVLKALRSKHEIKLNEALH